MLCADVCRPQRLLRACLPCLSYPWQCATRAEAALPAAGGEELALVASAGGGESALRRRSGPGKPLSAPKMASKPQDQRGNPGSLVTLLVWFSGQY